MGYDSIKTPNTSKNGGDENIGWNRYRSADVVSVFELPSSAAPEIKRLRRRIQNQIDSQKKKGQKELLSTTELDVGLGIYLQRLWA